MINEIWTAYPNRLNKGSVWGSVYALKKYPA